MARTFYTSTIASDLSTGGNFSNSLVNSPETVNVIVLTAPQSAVAAGSYFTASGIPGTDGTSTGTFTIRTNITASNTGINFRANLLRVNAAGTVQATVLGTYLAASVGTRTQTYNSPALGTWAAGDRFRVQYQIQNTNVHGGDKGITFETGQLAQDTPFAAGAVPNDFTQAVTGGLSFSGGLSTNFVPGPPEEFPHSETGGLSFSGGLSTVHTPAAGEEFTQAVTGGLSFVETFLRRIGRGSSGALTFSAALDTSHTPAPEPPTTTPALVAVLIQSD